MGFITTMLTATAQNWQPAPTYEARLENFEQINSREFQFDLMLYRTGPNNFFYSQMQAFIIINPLIKGTSPTDPTVAVVSGSSQLGGGKAPGNSDFEYYLQGGFEGIRMINPANIAGSVDAEILPTGTRVARVRFLRLPSTETFPEVEPNLTWSFDLTLQTKVFYNECEFDEDIEDWNFGGSYEITNQNSHFIDFSDLNSRPLSRSVLTTAGNWGTAGNWHNSATPNTGNNVLLKADGIANGNYALNNLWIETNRSLTINPSAQLTVNGQLFKDNPALDALTLQSDATGTASLIHNTTGIIATIERYIAAADWGVNGDGWHLISAPVSGQVIGGDWTPDGLSNNNYDFYGWDEPVQLWLNQKVGANNIFSFLSGEGYLVAYQEAGTKTFTGPVNAENVANIPITSSGTPDNDNHYGWNLVGNPFASALLWGGEAWGDVAGVAKIWSESGQGYVDIEPSDPIPSANGVFVFATQESGIVSMLAINRVHNTTPWYKSDDERILLVAGDAQGLTAQRSVVKFNPEATQGFDISFDAYFMSGYAPMFYSVADEKRFSTNTLPEMSGGMSIPFGFHKNAHTDFIIEMQETISDVIVNLTDLKLNHTQNLSEQPVYTFTSASEDDANRFLLSFTTVGNKEIPVTNLLQAYTYGNLLYVLSPAEMAVVELYNTQGQLILSQESRQGLNNIPLSVPSGSYIVRMISAGETATRKVVIN